jgi:wyosine [tRNA(Phe)-imidazoG37] synthetase (radical SAM superfamily)
MRVLISILSIGLILAGCNPNKDKIEQVNKLRTSLAATEEVFNQLDSATAANTLNSINEKLNEIQTLHTDTMTKETAFMVGEFANLRKALKVYLMMYPKNKKEFPYSRAQYDNLEQDLKNNVLSKDTFLVFYKEEQDAWLKLNDKVSSTTEGALHVIGLYEKQVPSIDSLIQQLKDTTFVMNK